MKKKSLYTALGLLSAFVLWTMAVRVVDVRAIGPLGSAVGFATLNGFVHELTGVHMTLYTITDWLGLVPVVCGLGFGALGLAQWIKRRSLRKVDGSILLLGGFYIVTLAAYLFFERYVVNYRPVLIAGSLEASYPSSTTLLVLCVMPTTMIQLQKRIRQPVLRSCVAAAISLLIAFMIIGRFLSGVHWLTDIVGGILLSAGLVMTYDSLIGGKNNE